jgi:hypothetical protein
MISTWLGLNPFTVVQCLVFAALLLGAIHVAADLFTRVILIRHWKLLVLLVAITILWRIPTQGRFFHGLEYEDSYVYTVAARQTLDPPSTYGNVGSIYLVNVCAVGSVEACYLFQGSSGHYIGLPAIIRIAIRCLGYTPDISNYLAIAASCLSTVVLFLLCQLLAGGVVSSAAASFLFASTPLFAIFGLASSAEPMSSACIAVALFYYLRYLYVDHATRWLECLNWAAFTITLLLAVLIKRENILLSLALPLGSIALSVARGKTTTRKLGWVLLGCLLVWGFTTTEVQVTRTITAETGEYGRFPFSISNARVLLPTFLRSFVSLEWYLLTGALAVVGLGVSIWRPSLVFLPGSLVLGYIALYMTHVRNYYLLHGASTNGTVAFRLSMNFMSVTSLLAGMGTGYLLSFYKRHSRRQFMSGLVLVCLYGIGSYGLTVFLQRRVSMAEFTSRINPALVASALGEDMGRPRAYIITEEPLVIQMFAPESTSVISLRVLTPQLLAKLRKDDPNASLLALDEETYHNSLTTARYATQLNYLLQFKQEELYRSDSFSVVQLCSKHADNGCKM